MLGTASWTSSSLARDPVRGRSSNAPLSPENQVTLAAAATGALSPPSTQRQWLGFQESLA